jgi:putative OPT family oligopeptide transporter
MREFTFKAILLGLFLAVILGAANAYLGLKAGMTISASFPAAVIAIAAFRLPFFKGSVLEQNITRTTAAVGEAMAAAAIFIIPSFVLVSIDGQRLWTTFHYWETSLIMLVGGLFGVLFIILLRRTLCVDATLPFPEGYACFEIVKAGQGGESGASMVFGAMGLGVLIELFKNSSGFAVIQECKEFFFQLPKSVVHHFNPSKKPLGDIIHEGGIAFKTPLASPALMGVGYIIGPKYASINFAGGVLAWLVFIPLALFLNPNLMTELSAGGIPVSWQDLAYSCWYNLVRPFAVGSMLVGAFYTLYGMRGSLVSAIKGVFSKHEHVAGQAGRLERDLNLKAIIIFSLLLLVPMGFLYYHFCGSTMGAIASAIILAVTGFVFAAVGGWLVGIMGNSNQPLSGLTLAALIIAALIMLLLGLKGIAGVAAVLGIAAVVCAAASMSGDIIQDLKVGQLIGGTPWKMELAGIFAVIVMAFVLVFPLVILHEGNIMAGGIGIGDAKLPAPQAGLMAQLATGIVGGQMPWGLIFMGMCFTVALILIKAPSPMLIAVGMYLPFETTFAIFVGGVFKWFLDRIIAKRGLSDKEREAHENRGILIASGFIAGEAVTGVLLAALVLLGIPSITQWLTGKEELAILGQAGGWLSIIVFAIIGVALIALPMKKAKTS